MLGIPCETFHALVLPAQLAPAAALKPAVLASAQPQAHGQLLPCACYRTIQTPYSLYTHALAAASFPHSLSRLPGHSSLRAQPLLDLFRQAK